MHTRAEVQTHVILIRKAWRRHDWHLLCSITERFVHFDRQKRARLCSMMYRHEHGGRHDVCQGMCEPTARFAHRTQAL